MLRVTALWVLHGPSHLTFSATWWNRYYYHHVRVRKLNLQEVWKFAQDVEAKLHTDLGDGKAPLLRFRMNRSQMWSPAPAASASPWNLLEMQTHRPRSRPTEPDALGVGPGICALLGLPEDSDAHSKLRTIDLYSSASQRAHPALQV